MSKNHIAKYRGKWLLIVVCSASAGRAGIIRHDRDVQSYRSLGACRDFQSVGKVSLPEHSEQVGSCVLVTPRWVLTAAHVVQRELPLKDHRFTVGKVECCARRVVFHPRSNHETEEVDLALVELQRRVQGVRPAVRYGRADEIGLVMTKVGYGRIGDGERGCYYPPRQQRRGGRNVIDAAGGTFGDLVAPDHLLLMDFDSPKTGSRNRLGDANPLSLEIGGSRGDSGGGWFVRDDQNGGVWKLVAVTCSVVAHDGDPHALAADKKGYGTIGAGVRISAVNAWIDEVIGSARAGRFSSEAEDGF